jgi:hypothetical protein
VVEAVAVALCGFYLLTRRPVVAEVDDDVAVAA